MTADQTHLAEYVEAWRATAEDTIALLRSLDDADWSLPTDLPGWDVRAVAAHLAHLESELAGNPQAQVEVPEAPHVNGPMGQFTEAGPIARAGWRTDQIIDELELAVHARYQALLAAAPIDPTAPGNGFAALVGWSCETLLRNRVLDVWMHEQDIRRAVGRPGGVGSPGAMVTAEIFTRSLTYVVGKRVRPAPGTTVVLAVTGAHPQLLGAEVGDDGRARLLDEVPADPTVAITLDFEDWALLSGGRRRAEQVPAGLTGDKALGLRVLESMAVTP